MDFHLEFTPRPFPKKISHQHRLLLMGSCFTEQIGAKLLAHKFRVIENPHGILFNPVSIGNALHAYIIKQEVHESNLFCRDGIWGSWDHHTRFSAVDSASSINKINASNQVAHDFLKQADWLILTLGSAFVYELEGGRVVANCHKVPTDKFTKRLLTVEETMACLRNIIDQAQAFNPGINIIFTISPVRHLRDGFIENNRSKSTLIQAVHSVVAPQQHTFYFPAYELVIDDLRDYRFYAEDMVHPNYAATNYVWEKFLEACVHEDAKPLMKEIAAIQSAYRHKPFQPQSEQHRHFLQVHALKTRQLMQNHPYLNLGEELAFFTTGIQ